MSYCNNVNIITNRWNSWTSSLSRIVVKARKSKIYFPFLIAVFKPNMDVTQEHYLKCRKYNKQIKRQNQSSRINECIQLELCDDIMAGIEVIFFYFWPRLKWVKSYFWRGIEWISHQIVLKFRIRSTEWYSWACLCTMFIYFFYKEMRGYQIYNC